MRKVETAEDTPCHVSNAVHPLFPIHGGHGGHLVLGDVPNRLPILPDGLTHVGEGTYAESVGKAPRLAGQVLLVGDWEGNFGKEVAVVAGSVLDSGREHAAMGT